jgi:ABC-type branched-subunit amino acid transport system substrate-binding protein
LFKFLHSRWIYIPVASIIIVMLALGAILWHPSLLPKGPLFPPLCSGNFQSARIPIVPTPATSTSHDGEPIGLSVGASVFDLHRSNPNVLQYKIQAAQAVTMNDPQNVVLSLKNTISSDPTDAEAQIYLENWKVLASNRPHITLVVGVSFASTFARGASRGTLQGAFTAQKECNDHNQHDSRKTQIVLMIANIGGNNAADRARSARFVATQIADQAGKDTTIVGIMGWPSSADSINVNHQLKISESQLPMVSPSASSGELEGMSNFFRVCPTNARQAQIAANFMLKKMQKSRVTVLYDQTTSYGNNLATDFIRNIRPNNMVGWESYTGGDPKTLQDALPKILAQKPDAIFFAGYVSDLMVLLKKISSTSYANLLVVGGDAPANTNSYPSPLPDLRNVYFTAFASPYGWDSIDPTPPFFQEYQANFGILTAPTGLPSIDVSVMLSYDAMLTLLHGSGLVLSKYNNTLTPSHLEDELKQITGANAIQGVTGRIAFDSHGNQDQDKVIFVEHIQGTSLVIDERHGCLRVTDTCPKN